MVPKGSMDDGRFGCRWEEDMAQPSDGQMDHRKWVAGGESREGEDAQRGRKLVNLVEGRPSWCSRSRGR